MRGIEVAAAAAAASMLCACGGGGGGGGIKEVSFTSFPVSNQRVVMTGISQTASGTMTISPTGDITVNSVGVNVVDDANSTARLTFSPGSTLSGISFTTPQSSASFSSGQINCSQPPACDAANATGSSSAAVINPTAVPPLPWNYQTFGVWMNQTGPTTFTVGAMSAGAVTPGTALTSLTTNGVLFNGLASGFYVDAGGSPWATAAGMQATVDFNLRQINFSTFGTQGVNVNTLAVFDDTLTGTFNITGLLTYNPGVNRFSGPVAAPGLAMSGTADGRFYGPTAQEMGGVYDLSAGASRLFGAFGARQP